MRIWEAGIWSRVRRSGDWREGRRGPERRSGSSIEPATEVEGVESGIGMGVGRDEVEVVGELEGEEALEGGRGT